MSCADCGRGLCPDCMVHGPVGIRCPEHAGVRAKARPTARTFRRTRTPGRGVLANLRSLDTLATWALIAANLTVYLIMVSQATNRGGGFDDAAIAPLWLDFILSAGFLGVEDEWYRLVTSFFTHVGVFHLLCNMAGLWWLGSVVERSLGTLRFILVYFVSGLAGSAGALIFDPLVFTAGASGAIIGVMAALVVTEWLRTRTLYSFALLYIGFLLVISAGSDFLSFGGHLGGVVGGALATFVIVQWRYRYRSAGLAAAALSGVASIATAYVRVETYTYPTGAQPPMATQAAPDRTR